MYKRWAYIRIDSLFGTSERFTIWRTDSEFFAWLQWRNGNGTRFQYISEMG